MGGGGGSEYGNLIPFLGDVFRWPFLLPRVKEWRGPADIRTRIPGGLLPISSGEGESESLAEVRNEGDSVDVISQN